MTSSYEFKAYVGGIHCYACCWLIENSVAKRFPGCHVQVNVSTREALFTWSSPEGVTPSLIGLFLSKLGYELLPQHESIGSTSNRLELIRLGVVWFCTLNIMLLAFADYVHGNAAGQISDRLIYLTFRGLQALLATLVMTYGAWPFYRNAINHLKVRRVTIDQPIALAMLATFGFSVANLFVKSSELYFDSLTAIVALLLSGRRIQEKLLQHAELKLRQSLKSSEGHIRILQGTEVRWCRYDDVTIGQIMAFFPGDLIPVGGTLLSPFAEVSREILTGEPIFEPFVKGDNVPAGYINGNAPIEIIAVENGTKNSLKTLLDSATSLLRRKGKAATLTDKFGTVFLFFVPALSLGTYIYWWQSTGLFAAKNAVAVLLVACPCTFGLATPLIFARAISLSFMHGILFRSQRGLEAAAGVKKLFFDKTGTLTQGTLNVVTATWNEHAVHKINASKQIIVKWIEMLGLNSQHQVAIAVAAWAKEKIKVDTAFHLAFENDQTPELKNIHESFGKGIKAKVEVNGKSHELFLGSLRGRKLFLVDEAEVVCFSVDERLREDAPATVKQLKGMGLDMEILSGDRVGRTEKIAKKLGIKSAHGGLSPSNKGLYLRNRGIKEKFVAMVGNGFNDMPALGKSGVAISVKEAPASVRMVADIYLFKEGLLPLVDAFTIAKAAVKAQHRALVVGLIYNVFGLSMAVSGYLSPLIAAILMPLSSASIIVIATTWIPRSSEAKGILL